MGSHIADELIKKGHQVIVLDDLSGGFSDNVPKGATFVQMFDPDAARIAAVVDLNPAKQDRYLGGTGHRVVSPEAAAAIAPATILVMNPAYEAEIGDYVRGHGWRADIVVVR